MGALPRHPRGPGSGKESLMDWDSLMECQEGHLTAFKRPSKDLLAASDLSNIPNQAIRTFSLPNGLGNGFS